MAIAFVAGDAANGNVSAALNSAAANFAVVQAGCWPNAATAVVEGGGYSNVWNALPDQGNANHHGRFFWSFLTSKGAGHTFGHNGGSPCVHVSLFSGVPTDAIIAEIKQALTLAAGTVTPSLPGSLIVAGVINQSGVQTAISSGLAIVDVPIGAGSNVGGSMAYLIQAVAAAITPVWTGGSGAVASQTIVVSSPAVSMARVSQLTPEVLVSLPVTARISQVVPELLVLAPAVARLSQITVETLQSNVIAPAGGADAGIWMGDGGGSNIWIE